MQKFSFFSFSGNTTPSQQQQTYVDKTEIKHCIVQGVSE